MITAMRDNVIMLKIKHKELASLLGVSEQYSRLLLYRHKLHLSNKNLNEIINLVIKRREDAHNRLSKDIER